MSFKDAKRLWLGIWYKEQLINKKRRWLMRSLSKVTFEVDMKKLKKVKSKKNTFLAESYVRSDEKFAEMVKVEVRRRRSSFNDTGDNFHEIQNRVVPPDANMELLSLLHHSCEVLKKTENCFENQLSFHASACSSILPSINKVLESLDIIPITILVALNRKLRGTTAVPKFPPSKISYKKEVLINRIRNRVHKLIMSPQHGNTTLEVLIKAVSVIILFFKSRAKDSDALTSISLSSSQETVDMQNNILKALWSLPNVSYYQHKALQSAMGLNPETCSNGFLNDLKQHLIHYLFECDEIDVPNEVSDVLSIINRSLCSQAQICSKESSLEESEAVLNVSSELVQIVSDLCSTASVDDNSTEWLERAGDTDSNDFELVEKDYCSTRGISRTNLSIYEEGEATGDSMPENHKEDGDDTLISQSRYNEASEDGRYVSIKEICDETSLISHRLIGRMLDSYLQKESRNVAAEASSSSAGKMDMLDTPAYDGADFLMQSLKGLPHSIPIRSIQRVEEFIKKP